LEIKRLVLVVDDEPGILRFVKARLQLAGYNVVAVSNGAQALAITRSGTPDIMVLDIYMEPMSGFDVLRELRSFSHLPVVIITARKEAADMALKQGADGYVLKPFEPDDLVKEIERVMAEATRMD